MWRWLVREWQWPAATLFAAAFLFAILPVFAATAGLAMTLVFVQLPIYMGHQFEEHAGDRFRLYVNRVIGGGREALTPGATFWINSLGVWGVDLVAILLAWLVAPSAGLAAGYLSLVNGVVHVLQAFARREYNPGLVTAIVLLIPAGAWCVWETGSGAGFDAHAFGLGAAIGVHVAIVAHVVLRLKRLSREAGQVSR